MPKLWTDTVETHRREVRDAVLHATWKLVSEGGALAVTMSQVAAEVGIGRATLYKYFPDVESILRAWHEQQVEAHLAQLTELRDKSGDPAAALAAVLGGYAKICWHRTRHGVDGLEGVLHRAVDGVRGVDRLHALFTDVLRDAAGAGAVRSDVAPGELASYCVHALAAAGHVPSKPAVERLVGVVVAGLAPIPEG
ncbi:TetR/AcrR family transcriptional regulator [Kribbella sp. HUAS MG21]|uniref:TetR/AcrR family transcriptional regulator n=1 Tax=Kribbella sp. HUAS MG21 TaxID=3160966 RepID=A0AAU7TAJ2_9ACTN